MFLKVSIHCFRIFLRSREQFPSCFPYSVHNDFEHFFGKFMILFYCFSIFVFLSLLYIFSYFPKDLEKVSLLLSLGSPYWFLIHFSTHFCWFPAVYVQLLTFSWRLEIVFSDFFQISPMILEQFLRKFMFVSYCFCTLVQTLLRIRGWCPSCFLRVFLMMSDIFSANFCWLFLEICTTLPFFTRIRGRFLFCCH